MHYRTAYHRLQTNVPQEILTRVVAATDGSEATSPLLLFKPFGGLDGVFCFLDKSACVGDDPGDSQVREYEQ